MKKMNIFFGELNSGKSIFMKNKRIAIICPECKESILINIKNYKINLSKCKNGHEIKNILLKDYEKTQYIDISKINNNNKCIKHNNNFDKYCNDCNLNICIKCYKEHRTHNTIYLGELLMNDEINMNELKEYIDKFNNYIKIIIEKLNNVIKNMEIYYNISNNIINNCEDLNYFNYQIIKNIEQFKIYNNIIIKDIKEIIDENGYNKFKNIMDIYDKMNNNSNKEEDKEIKEIKDNNNIKQNINNEAIQIKKDLNTIENNNIREELNKIDNNKSLTPSGIQPNNYILANIIIDKYDLNKDIKIINSYEEYIRENPTKRN